MHLPPKTADYLDGFSATNRIVLPAASGVSYLFGAVIIALVINIVASLL